MGQSTWVGGTTEQGIRGRAVREGTMGQSTTGRARRGRADWRGHNDAEHDGEGTTG